MRIFQQITNLNARSSSLVYVVPAEKYRKYAVGKAYVETTWFYLIRNNPKLKPFMFCLHGFPGLFKISNLLLEDLMFSIVKSNIVVVNFQSVAAEVWMIAIGDLPLSLTWGAYVVHHGDTRMISVFK